ncbi:MAG: hypothetical protein GEV08_03885 [Acidimicrobiia bacterium]|nr:hypothetical protein [Acidimicrobiia bacterium]
MAERGRFARRVFLQDPRGDAQHLRVTWHPEASQFVFSAWRHDVCVAAVRVDAHDAPQLIALLANGLGDAVPAPPAAPGSDEPHRRGWRGWLSRRLAAPEPPSADVVGLPDRPPTRDRANRLP